MRLIVVALVALLVAGCATHESIARGIREKYVGRPLAEAMKGLGYPDRETVISGRRIVTWEVKGDLDCALRMEVNDRDMVVGSSISGTLGGCSVFEG